MKRRSTWAGTLACLLATAVTWGQQPPAAASSNQLDVAHIVDQLVQHNDSRAAALRHYDGCRHYSLQYTGFPHMSAEMVVAVNYNAPADKQFRIVREDGSHLLISRVLHELLTNEKAAQQDPGKTALTPANYEFHFVGTDNIGGRRQYVLEVDPHTKNKFLYHGKVWVDAEQFAVYRISAEPAQNPSFWISHTEIEHQYEKLGEFWLPAHNTSITKVRVGGTAKLNIDYLNYEINPSSPTHVADICSDTSKKTQVSESR